jgi:hypothetical protein
MVWAEEFCRIFTGHTILPEGAAAEKFKETRGVVDEGGMVAWFASAIETGRNAGRKETCPHPTYHVVSEEMMLCTTCGLAVYGEPD